MERKNIYYQAPETITINTINVPVDFEFDLDKGYNTLLGIAFEAGSFEDFELVNLTELAEGLRVDNELILPKYFDIKRLVCGYQLNMNERYFKLCEGIYCEGAKIKGSVVCTAGTIPVGGFRLKLYTVLTNLEKNV